jgi:15-O-acetyltransferase Tri3
MQHRAHFRSFSLQESISLLQCVKVELGRSATITHLGHAAMVLAMLRLEGSVSAARCMQASQRSKSTTFSSPCWMNGRRYLDPRKLGGMAYISVCQALGEVVFPDVEQYSISRTTSDIERRKVLIRAAKVAGASYQNIKERKSILSESVPLMEYLAQKQFQCVLVDLYLMLTLRLFRSRDSETMPASARVVPPVSPRQLQ